MSSSNQKTGRTALDALGYELVRVSSVVTIGAFESWRNAATERNDR